jgi:hypothetical protein
MLGVYMEQNIKGSRKNLKNIKLFLRNQQKKASWTYK